MYVGLEKKIEAPKIWRPSAVGLLARAFCPMGGVVYGLALRVVLLFHHHVCVCFERRVLWLCYCACLLFCLLAVEMMVGFGGDEVDGMLVKCCVVGVGSSIVGLWLIPCVVGFSLIQIL
jgi:hypothetical protein